MTVEEQLRALDTFPVELPAGLARTSWHRGRCQRRQQWGAGAAMGAVVLAGTASAATHLSASHTATLATAVAPADQPSDSPSASPSDSMSPSPSQPAVAVGSPGTQAEVEAQVTSAQAMATKELRAAAMASIDPQLSAISLPDPAPGFPFRREPDQGVQATGWGPGHDGISIGWLLAQKAHADSSSPTGPEASITVARAGSFTTSPGADGKADTYPVIGTTTARGVPATIVRPDGKTELLLSVGGFAISVSGSSGDLVAGVPTSRPDVPVSQLVALADALQNIPAN